MAHIEGHPRDLWSLMKPKPFMEVLQSYLGGDYAKKQREALARDTEAGRFIPSDGPAKFPDAIKDFLIKKSDPTMLPANDVRIRDQMDREKGLTIQQGPSPLAHWIEKSKQAEPVVSVDNIGPGLTNQRISQAGPPGTVLPKEYANIVPDSKKFDGGDPTLGTNYTANVTEDPNAAEVSSPNRKRKLLPEQKEYATPEKPANKGGENPEDTPSLWKTWGSLADDPKKRRDAYLGSIKNIYMKKMLLDSIANLTGGVSQGGSWAEMAIAELDAVEKFDSEQRLHNQWKALFFNENGDYNPPKNRKEAMERGQKLDYDADQMKDIMSVFPKEQVSNLELTKRYIDSLPEGSAERIALEKKHLGMYEDEKDDRTSYEKFIERIVNSGLLSKEEGDEALMRKAKGTDSGLTAAQDNFKWYQGILAEGDEEKIAVANKFLGISGKKAAKLGEFLRLYESQTFQDSDTFSPKEKAMLEELLKKAMGLGVSTVTTDSPSGITIKKKL